MIPLIIDADLAAQRRFEGIGGFPCEQLVLRPVKHGLQSGQGIKGLPVVATAHFAQIRQKPVFERRHEMGVVHFGQIMILLPNHLDTALKTQSARREIEPDLAYPFNHRGCAGRLWRVFPAF